MIALGMSYVPRRIPCGWRGRHAWSYSAYAQGADYHDVMKKALKRLARWW
ncbi:MAG: DUF1730 domain-containing protein [Caenibius sp.]